MALAAQGGTDSSDLFGLSTTMGIVQSRSDYGADVPKKQTSFLKTSRCVETQGAWPRINLMPSTASRWIQHRQSLLTSLIA